MNRVAFAGLHGIRANRAMLAVELYLEFRFVVAFDGELCLCTCLQEM